jgi:hypothetical protein
MRGYMLINYSSFTIVYVDGKGIIQTLESKIQPRFLEDHFESTDKTTIDGIRLVNFDARIIELPEPIEDRTLIVDPDLYFYHKDRNDLITPVEWLNGFNDYPVCYAAYFYSK